MTMSRNDQKKHDALLSVLRDVEAFIESGWVQHHGAVNASGEPCFANDPQACRWCITGAISRAVYLYRVRADNPPWPLESLTESVARTARILIRDTISRRYPQDIMQRCPDPIPVPVWNDAAGRTQQECLSVIRETIDHVSEATANNLLSFLELS